MVAQLPSHLTQMHMVHKSLLELYYNKNVVVSVFRLCDFYNFLCAVPHNPQCRNYSHIKYFKNDYSDSWYYHRSNSGYKRTSSFKPPVKRLPAMRETWVRSLGREDPLEKEVAIHSSTLAWKIPWTEEPDRLQSMGSQRVGHD